MTAFTLTQVDESQYPRFAELLRQQFGTPLSPDIFRNPFGPPICRAIEHEGRFVAYYSVFPARCVSREHVLTAYRGGPYTLVEFRKRGFYADLARAVFAEIDKRSAIHIGFPNAVDTFLTTLNANRISEVTSYKLALTADDARNTLPVTSYSTITESPLDGIDDWFDPWWPSTVPPGRNYMVRTAAYYRWIKAVWLDRSPNASHVFVKLEDENGLFATAFCAIREDRSVIEILDLAVASAPQRLTQTFRLLRSFATSKGSAGLHYGTSEPEVAAILEREGWNQVRTFNFHLYRGPNVAAELGDSLVERPWYLTPFDQAMS